MKNWIRRVFAFSLVFSVFRFSIFHRSTIIYGTYISDPRFICMQFMFSILTPPRPSHLFPSRYKCISRIVANNEAIVVIVNDVTFYGVLVTGICQINKLIEFRMYTLCMHEDGYRFNIAHLTSSFSIDN